MDSNIMNTSFPKSSRFLDSQVFPFKSSSIETPAFTLMYRTTAMSAYGLEYYQTP